MYIKKNITVIIVTYKTNRNILLNCLSSINRDINILIVENSKRFDGKTVFLKKFKDAGATILGGCCETRPSHIKAFTLIK